MDVGNRIKQLREAAGMTQAELAEKMAVTRQTISNWERGRTYPDIVSVIRMSDLYGISLDALLKGDGVLSIHADGELAAAVESLAGDAEKRRILGEKAKAAVCRHAGALEKTIKLLEENRSCQA